MKNITFLSLSVQSILTFSPLFVGNNNFLSQSSFKFYNPVIFYNYKSLILQKNYFNHGLGPLLISSGSPYEYYDIENENIPEKIHHTTEQCLCIIRDCIFSGIVMKDDAFIDIESSSSFYLTDCVFSSCTAQKKPLLYLKTRASKITHMCCANIKGVSVDNDDKKQSLILETNTETGSFFRMIYSTVVGDDSEINKMQAIYYHGTCSLQVQCNNFSNIRNRLTENIDNYDRLIISIIGQRCLQYQMNTISKMECTNHIICVNLQNGDEENNGHYIGFSNFIDNRYGGWVISLSLFAKTNMYICDSIFRNNQDDAGNTGRFIRQFNKDPSFSVIRCIFDNNLDTFDCKNPTFENTQVNENVEALKLAHFVTDIYCQGEPPIDAFGCNNDTCPENKGCPEGAFDFTDNDLKYTDKLHTMFDTPTPSPTVYFSNSIAFSFSSPFSNTDEFSKTKYFSNSEKFTETKGFSNTEMFSISTQFSESDKFSNSGYFSTSDYFSNSDYFTETAKFSNTQYFSNSDKFTETEGFSVSTSFSKSNYFTESDDFSKSSYFSSTSKFTKTGEFSETDYFSHTKQFTESTYFSESTFFTKSTYFSESNDFTKSLMFTETGKFSKTSPFSETSEFSETTKFTESTKFTVSSLFTQSSYFTQSYNWNQTHTFSPSKSFTQSSFFSSSFYFSQTNYFSKTIEFTKTGLFSYSELFTVSADFSDSLHFTKSSNFDSTSFFKETSKFSSSFYFTKTGLFSSSELFTESDYFTGSLHFSDSNTFGHQNTNIVINIKTDDSKKLTTPIKIGIGVACGAAALIAAIVGFLLLRRKSSNIEDIENETIEIADNTTNSFCQQNPLLSLMNDDDPFQDEFD